VGGVVDGKHDTGQVAFENRKDGTFVLVVITVRIKTQLRRGLPISSFVMSVGRLYLEPSLTMNKNRFCTFKESVFIKVVLTTTQRTTISDQYMHVHTLAMKMEHK
jgi:hypothetical protein